MKHVGHPDWGIPDPHDQQYCSLSVGGGGGSESSKQRSESGVSPAGREQATGDLFSLISNILLPGLQQFGRNVPRIETDPTTGLTPQQTGLVGNLVNTGVREQFSKLSGGGAVRGQLSPANTSALVGSATERAVTSALPQFAQQAQENLQFNTTAQRETESQMFQFLQNLGGLLLGLTQGSTGKQSSSGSRFNFDLGVGARS